ncbi:PLP-dependent cysteine synthase family protein [Chloroflexota bacterium]
MLKVANNVTDLIGETPLLRINNLTKVNSATIFAKLEWYNISGSVKDRMALYLIEYAEAMGKLSKEKTILEATSGNTGIALSMIAAAKGYKIQIVMPESVSVERREIIQAYGAKLVLSPGEKGTGGAVELKQQILEQDSGNFTDIDQFKDPANIMAHYQTTGKEIIEQTNGKLDMVVVGIGTAGTGVGTSMRIKQYNPAIKIVGVTPKLGVSIQGLRNSKEAYPTQLFREKEFDEVVEMGKEEIPAIFGVAQRMAKEEGLLAGISSGAIMHIALQKAQEMDKDKIIVAVLPDSGEKYFSTDLYK